MTSAAWAQCLLQFCSVLIGWVGGGDKGFTGALLVKCGVHKERERERERGRNKQCRGTLNGPYSIEAMFFISVILS